MPERLTGRATRTRLGHIWLAAAALPGLMRSRRQRALFTEMRALGGHLPELMQQPLPQAMQALAAKAEPIDLPEHDVRRLADLAALFARESPLGICLRRSLLRYHFLKRAGLPLSVAFGARLRQNAAPDGEAGSRAVAGHAWVTLNGSPYHESHENWRNFQVIYRWPQ